jgi:hypothetical protein
LLKAYAWSCYGYYEIIIGEARPERKGHCKLYTRADHLSENDDDDDDFMITCK